MKFEDVKRGMRLRDPKGNEWKVLDICNGNIPTIYVYCTKFMQPVGITPQCTVDTEAKAFVNRHMYVNRKHLIIAKSAVIEQFKPFFATGQQCINVVTGLNKSQTLCFVTQKQFDNVEVTLEDLVEVPEVQTLTRDNIHIGMSVRTASNISCFVFAYTECFVHLKTNFQSLDSEGALKQITADLLVNWYDSKLPYPANVLTTKDFTIIR